jgi:hypothetical protein
MSNISQRLEKHFILFLIIIGNLSVTKKQTWRLNVEMERAISCVNLFSQQHTSTWFL